MTLEGLPSVVVDANGPFSSPLVDKGKPPMDVTDEMSQVAVSPGVQHNFELGSMGSLQPPFADSLVSAQSKLNLPLGLFEHSSKLTKRKFASSNESAFGSKRGVSLTHSPLMRPGMTSDSPALTGNLDSDTSELEEHITLAVLKARRAKIALRKRQSPRKYALVDDSLASATGLLNEQFSLSSKMGIVVGPQSPLVGQ